MNETEQLSTTNMNGSGSNHTTSIPVDETVTVPIENADGGLTVVIEGQTVTVTNEELAEALSDIISEDEPKDDSVNAVLRFLLGAALEGTVEFKQRLALWETYLRSEMPETEEELTEASERELLRYALIGAFFGGEELSRRTAKKMLGVPVRMTKTAVRISRPVTRSRLVKPFMRPFERLADRGEIQVKEWAERGEAEETLGRFVARIGTQEIVDEFINHLAANDELKDLVKEQSLGLAGGAVEQVRERSFSADTLVERIARAVTRRNPRMDPPMADLSEYPQDEPPLFNEEDIA
jgi:hypothetical protein